MSSAKVLVVEDEGIVALDIRERLQALGYLVVAVADSGGEAVRLAGELHPDVVLMDIRLHGPVDGITAAEQIRHRFHRPVIYLTAYADDHTLARAKVTEPFGYLLKPVDDRELRTSIEMALYKHEAEQKLRESERRYATTLTSIGDAVIAVDREERVTFVNPVAEQMTGWSMTEAVGRPLADIFTIVHQQTRQPVPSPVTRALQENAVIELPEEVLLISRGGRESPIADCIAPIRSNGQGITGAVLAFRDISERKRAEEERRKLEARMLQTQKLQSLGLLAGGIAHDFNNILTTVLGYADLALHELPPDSPVRGNLEQIMSGARRAAELTNQMLAYAGKAPFVIQQVRLSELVREMAEFLRISISRKCLLRYRLADDLPPIEGDPTQLRQIVMNLVLNAAEAIGDQEGMILLTTGLRHCDRTFLAESFIDDDLPEGSYVWLEVTDTGCGMPPSTLARIFDPFYSTKFVGRGLGLAAVLGILRSHRGTIRVSSEPGRGSSFLVFFPAAASTAPPPPSPPAEPWQGSGTILVVEDDEYIRKMATHMLDRLGFTLLTASDGKSGVELFQQHHAEVAAVLLDLTMPRLDGREALTAFRAIQADVPVIVMSGLGERHIAETFAGQQQVVYLPKPFDIDQLTRVLKRVMS
jgi:PAS domain S-box-containing protein